MEASRLRCTVVLPDGPSRRVGPSGLWIGRQRDCDIVATDPSVSRRHALVHLTSDGVEVVPLGKGAIEVNGKRCDRPTALADGDRLAVPGLELTVQVSAQRADAGAATATFRLERARGGNFGIGHSPFLIGGGDSDDLIVGKWPEHAIRLHLAQGELYVEATVAKVLRNGEELEVGALEPIGVEDELAFRKETFVVRQTARDATTAAIAGSDLPRRVVVELLPRGGRVVFSVSDGERAVFLADRRLDLIVALLKPPDGVPGDFVSDDAVRQIVWPRNPGVSRPEINMLISRCRRDLVEAGLAGGRLIERAPGGGATRLLLAPDATVEVG